MKAKAKLAFAAFPRDYAGLCGILTPRPIRDHADYDSTVEVTDTMTLHANEFSADREDYFDVLCTLIEHYDNTRAKWPAGTPLQRLRDLADEHGMSGADLARLLGVTRRAGAMLLSGERAITAEHARALGVHFGLPAGAFI